MPTMALSAHPRKPSVPKIRYARKPMDMRPTCGGVLASTTELLESGAKVGPDPASTNSELRLTKGYADAPTPWNKRQREGDGLLAFQQRHSQGAHSRSADIPYRIALVTPTHFILAPTLQRYRGDGGNGWDVAYAVNFGSECVPNIVTGKAKAGTHSERYYFGGVRILPSMMPSAHRIRRASVTSQEAAPYTAPSRTKRAQPCDRGMCADCR